MRLSWELTSAHRCLVHLPVTHTYLCTYLFWGRVSMSITGWSWTRRGLPASASWVAGIKQHTWPVIYTFNTIVVFFSHPLRLVTSNFLPQYLSVVNTVAPAYRPALKPWASFTHSWVLSLCPSSSQFLQTIQLFLSSLTLGVRSLSFAWIIGFSVRLPTTTSYFLLFSLHTAFVFLPWNPPLSSRQSPDSQMWPPRLSWICLSWFHARFLSSHHALL